MKNLFLLVLSLSFTTVAFASTTTLHCVSDENDIAKISPYSTNANGFWSLHIPKQFEIVSEGINIKTINYRFEDLVREADIVFDSSDDTVIAFEDSYLNLGEHNNMYKGYESTSVNENSRKASIKLRSKFKKWGMDNDGVNKTWTLKLDKSTLTGTIEGISKNSRFPSTKLATKFSCTKE